MKCHAHHCELTAMTTIDALSWEEAAGPYYLLPERSQSPQLACPPPPKKHTLLAQISKQSKANEFDRLYAT